MEIELKKKKKRVNSHHLDEQKRIPPGGNPKKEIDSRSESTMEITKRVILILNFIAKSRKRDKGEGGVSEGEWELRKLVLSDKEEN